MKQVSKHHLANFTCLLQSFISYSHTKTLHMADMMPLMVSKGS